LLALLETPYCYVKLRLLYHGWLNGINLREKPEAHPNLTSNAKDNTILRILNLSAPNNTHLLKVNLEKQGRHILFHRRIFWVKAKGGNND
jgi:hypothetical protein